MLKYADMSAEARLQQLGFTLPPVAAAGGNYLSSKRVGDLLFLSGVISSNSAGVMAGVVGRDRTLEEGYAAARQCALNQLAVIRQALGSLDRVRHIISLTGYVNAIPEFPDSPKVINGASDLLIEIFGDPGRHVRAAVGVCALPRNAMVEVQMTIATEREADADV
jgi:enamine deaminase RidA (YjgF/YER057c/UK114 family)